MILSYRDWSDSITDQGEGMPTSQNKRPSLEVYFLSLLWLELLRQKTPHLIGQVAELRLELWIKIGVD